MKRVLFFTVLALFSHFAMGQEAPSVTIQVVSTTPTKVTASFTKNATCTKYHILIVKTAEIAMNEQFARKPIHRLIQEWGLHFTPDSTYTWKELVPNTAYTVFALANDSTNPLHQTVEVTTPQVGGTGKAQQTIAISDITDNTAKTTITPNVETSIFWYGLVSEDAYNAWGHDAAVESVIQGNQYYPKYETDFWVWPDLKPNTSYYAISRGKNINNEWGDAAIEKFTTTGTTFLEEANNIDISIFPNPAQNYLIVHCNGITKLELFDLAGKQVLAQGFNGVDNGVKLNVSLLEKGTYVLRIITSNGVATKKVVVDR